MTDPELTEALKMHYALRLPTDLETRLVRDARARRVPWMSLVLALTAVAALWLAWRGNRSHPAAPPVPEATTELTCTFHVYRLTRRARKRVVAQLELPEGRMKEFGTTPAVPEGASLVIKPTLITQPGTPAEFVMGTAGALTHLELLANPTPEGAWTLEVAVGMPDLEGIQRFRRRGPDLPSTVAMVVDGADTPWLVLADLVLDGP